MIKTAQRKMISPSRTDKKKIQIDNKDAANRKGEGIDKHADEESRGASDKETEEGSDLNSSTDQDSDVSCQDDAEEEIDATENEEDWIEYIKRSTEGG